MSQKLIHNLYMDEEDEINDELVNVKFENIGYK